MAMQQLQLLLLEVDDIVHLELFVDLDVLICDLYLFDICVHVAERTMQQIHGHQHEAQEL